MIALHPSPRILSALFLVVPMLAPAYAKVVSYNFTGLTRFIVTDQTGNNVAVSSFDAPGIGTVSIGDVVTGTLTYESQSEVVSDIDGELRYESLTTKPIITYHIGNINRQFSFGRNQSITALDRPEGDLFGDLIGFYGTSTLFPPEGSWMFDYGRLSIGGQGIQFLDSPRLPEYLSLIGHGGLEIHWNFPGDGNYMLYQEAWLTSLTPVPEPSAFALVGAGLGIFWLRRASMVRGMALRACAGSSP